MVLKDKLPRYVLDAFSVDKSASLEGIRGGFNNNWIITTEHEKFILKSRPATHMRNSVAESELSEFLTNKEFPTANPKKHFGGDYVLKHHDLVYSMFDFIEGRGYEDSASDLRSSATSMALFHKETNLYNGTLAFENNAISWLTELLKDYNGLYKKEFGEISRKSVNNITKIKNSLPTSTIHWDFHAGNLIIKRGKTYIFDFEFVHRDYRIMDIANTLTLLAALNPKEIDYTNALTFIKECELKTEKAEKFISNYKEVLTVSDNEIEALPDAMTLAWTSWCLYTFNKLRHSKKTAEGALYFPAWVQKNKSYIIESLVD